MTVDAENIPTSLRGRKQWVLWKLEERDGEKTKVPYMINGFRAAVNAPSMWETFQKVKLTFDTLEGYTGIGYIMAEKDPFVGIDLDDVVDENGAIEAWAWAIVERLNSYTEISPSGRGLRIFIEAKKPGPRCRTGSRPDFEVYEGARLLSVTGNRLPGTPEKIEKRQEELDALYAQIFPERDEPTVQAQPGKSSVKDGELLGKILASKQAKEFEALWDGDILSYPSASEADLVFCNILAFWTGRDESQIDRIFRASGRMRPKWDEKRGRETYGEITLQKAISGTSEVYEPPTHEEETGSSLENLKDKIVEDPEKALQDPGVLMRLIDLRKRSPITYDRLEVDLRKAEAVKSSTLRSILDAEAKRLSATCETCRDGPEEIPEDVLVEADKIVSAGRAFEYLYETWQSRHLGDERVGKALLGGFGAQRCSSTEGIHIQVNGPRESGKSHSVGVAIDLLPPRLVMSGSMSNMVLFYDAENAPPGTAVSIDDITYTEAFGAVQKRCTTGFQTGATHRSVVDTPEGKRARTFRTKPRMAFYTTSVDRHQDEQLRSRLWSIDADSSPEHKAEVIKFRQRKDAGELFDPAEEERKTAICRAIFEILDEEPLDVIIPFATRLVTIAGLDVRSYNVISDLTKALAAYRHRIRDRDDLGRILATVDDFRDAKNIFDATEGHSDVKFTSAEKRVLAAFMDNGNKATMGDLIRLTELTYQRVYEILNGRGKGEQKRHGLMSKAPISREQVSDSWTYDYDPNTRRDTKRKTVTEYVYYLDPSFKLKGYESPIVIKDEGSVCSVERSVKASVGKTNNKEEGSVCSVDNKKEGEDTEGTPPQNVGIHTPPSPISQNATETTETPSPLSIGTTETSPETTRKPQKATEPDRVFGKSRQYYLHVGGGQIPTIRQLMDDIPSEWTADKAKMAIHLLEEKGDSRGFNMPPD